MDKKLKLKTELKKKLKQEMSVTGTGASVTPGADEGVAAKYAFGKRANKGTPKDWKSAPSIPNRPSKAMDYKELWEVKRDQEVKITSGTHAGKTAVVHDFDSEKDSASGEDWVDVLIGSKKEKKTVKASELKPLKEIDTQNSNTDEILTYLQAAKQNGTLSPDAQEVFLQWMNDPNASREEIIKVLRKLTGMYLKENNLEEAKQEWNVKNIETMINDYAAQKGLNFKLVDRDQQVNQYGSKRTVYIYKLGDKDLIMIDDKAAGAPRLNDFRVAIGTREPGSTSLKDALSVSKFGSWGVQDVITMLDKTFKSEELKEEFKSGKEFINIKLQKYPKALTKINQLIDMIGEDTFTIDVAKWVFDFFNNASFEQPINEGYAQFRNATKTRSKPDQFHQAVKEIKRKMSEINRIFEYVDRLKTELSEGEDLKYKKYTENAFQQIKESAKQLFFKSTKLK